MNLTGEILLLADRVACRLLFMPYRAIARAGAWPLMLFAGLLCGILMFLAFKMAVNTAKIRHARRMMTACLLEIVLYRADPVATLKSLVALFKWQAIHLAAAIPGVLFAVVPLMFILPPTAAWLARVPAGAGEVILLQAELDPAVPVKEAELDMTASGGMVIETPPLRYSPDNTATWRARVTDPDGQPCVGITVNGSSFIIEPPTGGRPVPFSTGFHGNIPVPDGSGGQTGEFGRRQISTFRIFLPSRRFRMAGWGFTWSTVFASVSIMTIIALNATFPGFRAGGMPADAC